MTESNGRLRGFSLVEMSMVLLIVGLMIGGVMTGQSLMRGSKLKTIITQKENYVMATSNFRQKYKMLPGDFSKATTQWGAQHVTPATCRTTASTSKLTCDGSGDGRIGFDIATKYEITRFWQHLSNEGLIEGAYNGIVNGASYGQIPGTNIPQGPLEDTGFGVRWLGMKGDAVAGGPPPSGDPDYFNGVYKNVLFYGGRKTDDFSLTPVLSTEEAKALDNKHDDGKPHQGEIRTFKTYGAYSPYCARYISVQNYEYYVSYTDPNLCSLIFITGF